MKKYSYLFILAFICISFSGCKDKKPTKIIEEKDPMIKILHEKDSIRVFKTDSAEVDTAVD